MPLSDSESENNNTLLEKKLKTINEILSKLNSPGYSEEASNDFNNEPQIDREFVVEQSIAILSKIEQQQQQQKGIKKTKPKPKRRVFNWVNCVAALALIIGLVILNWQHVHIHFVYFFRLLIVLFVDFYDLTQFYSQYCLVPNPFQVNDNFVSPEDCQVACSFQNLHQHTIDKRASKSKRKNKTPSPQVFGAGKKIFDDTRFEELVFQSNMPVIDSNEMLNWPILNYSSKQISKIYAQQADMLSPQSFCWFENTLGMHEKEIKEYFNVTAKRRPKNGHKAEWENCDKMANKLMKKYYRRPLFLPPLIEMQNTWVLLSDHGSNIEYNAPPASLRFTMFCQVKGQSKIKIKTADECTEHCAESRFTLKQGQILIFSDLWTMAYKFTNKMDNSALLLLGST